MENKTIDILCVYNYTIVHIHDESIRGSLWNGVVRTGGRGDSGESHPVGCRRCKAATLNLSGKQDRAGFSKDIESLFSLFSGAVE